LVFKYIPLQENGVHGGCWVLFMINRLINWLVAVVNLVLSIVEGREAESQLANATQRKRL
jgi:hypothetical protein